MGILENAQSALEPDEKLRFAVTGQTGINPMFRFLWLGLNVFNKARIVVWTDKRIAIFSAGQARWARTQPRKLLSELPLGTRFERGKGSWSKIHVGTELIWFARNTYALFDKANAASS
jgi:hypothetical protein